MLDHKVNKPNLLVRPSQPQIIVIPQSILSNGGLKNILSFTPGDHKGPVVTRVVRPQVAIVKKPAEVSHQPVAIKRALPTISESSGNSQGQKVSYFPDSWQAVRELQDSGLLKSIFYY